MDAEQPLQGIRRRDPLLDTVRIALTISMVLAVVVALALIASTLLVLVLPGPVLEFLARHSRHAIPPGVLTGAAATQALLAVTAVLGFYFVRLLRRIIDSVAGGDPFIPENAVRLGQMGWLAVTVQLIAIPAGVVGGWIAHVTHFREFNVSFSIGGILLALILFVLARVFRKGAEMREELEATV